MNECLLRRDDLCTHARPRKEFPVRLASVNDVSAASLKRKVAVGHVAGDHSLTSLVSLEYLFDAESGGRFGSRTIRSDNADENHIRRREAFSWREVIAVAT